MAGARVGDVAGPQLAVLSVLANVDTGHVGALSEAG